MIKVSEVKLSNIKCENRARKDIGDLESLKTSISEYGLLEPIILDEDYNLIAGERRFRATEALNHKTIPARIISGITQDNKFLIELIENIERKDFTWVEELNLRIKIHNYYSQNHPGWTYRDSSKVLGISIGQISSDLEIYEAIQYFPELAELKTKNKARETYKRLVSRASAVSAMDNLSDEEKSQLSEMLNNSDSNSSKEKSKKSESQESESKESMIEGSDYEDSFDSLDPFAPEDESDESDKYKSESDESESSVNDLLSDNKFLYKICSWEELLPKFPGELIGFCEIDPPYAMDFNKVYGASQGYATNEYAGTSEADWDIDTLKSNLESLLPQLYEKLRTDSWVLLWTAIENVIWTNQIALNAGFKIQSPGFWVKPGGSSNSPSTTMISNRETFLLFRKGNAQFNTPSFLSAFECQPAHKSQRFHQWQKPIELYKKFFKAMSQPKTLFFSPFAGSGMSMITAIMYDMIPVGCDISQKYFYQFYTNMKEYLYDPSE